jgi:hypothetical protein
VQLVAFAQAKSVAAEPPAGHITSSAAYAEIALRRTELMSDLAALLQDYTDDFPRVKELKIGIEVLRRETLRLAVLKPAEAARLTSALGKLIVRKADVEVEFWRLQQSYSDGHPDVKRAKKRVEIFENAIKEILG